MKKHLILLFALLATLWAADISAQKILVADYLSVKDSLKLSNRTVSSISTTISGSSTHRQLATALSVYNYWPWSGTPSNGQVPKWNSTTSRWEPGADNTGGGGVTDGDKGDVDVSGTGSIWTVDTSAINTLKIADDAVTAAKIAANAVGSSELASTAVTAGTYGNATNVAQITVDADGRATNATNVAITFPPEVDGSTTNELNTTFDVSGGNVRLIDAGGTLQIPVTSIAPVQAIAAGTGISLSGTSTVTITNTGDTDASNDVTTSTTAGGDLTGTYPNPTVDKVDGTAVVATGATDGQVLKWSNANTRWEPAADATGSGGDGNGIYGGSGTVPASTEATITTGSTFDISYGTSGTPGFRITDNNKTSLFSPNFENVLEVDNDLLYVEMGAGDEIYLNSPEITLVPDGGVATLGKFGAATWRFYEPAAGGNYTEFATGAQSANYTYTLPIVGPTNDQVLTWNTGGQLSWETVDTDASNDVTTSTSAGGDLTGTYPNPTVDKVDGTAVLATGASDGQVLKWSNANTRWEPGNDVGGGAGDNWGSQVVERSTRLQGNGTSGSPLDVAQNLTYYDTRSASYTSVKDLIPVQAFGAVMNGSTDDYTAFRRSLDSVGYVYVYYDAKRGHISTRVNTQITLTNGMRVFSNNRKMQINAGVTPGQYLFYCNTVPFLGVVEIKNLTIQQVTASGGVRIFESRQVHVEDVTFLGNAVGTTAVYIDGDDTDGNAWNHVRDFLINDYTRGIYLYTVGTANYCNRNFIEAGTIQSSDTAIIMWRAATNMITNVGCQNSVIHLYLKSAQSNTIQTFNETQSSFSLVTDNDSYNNVFSGNVVETAMSLGTGRNVFLDGNYMDISKISNDLWFANLPISSPSSKGTAVVRTAAGSTDDLDFKLASNSVVKLVEAGGNGSDYAEFTDDVKLTAGNDLFLDGLKVQATRVETFEATHYYEYAPLGDQALGLDWRVPADYNGWTITAFSIVVGYNSCTNNIQGQLALNGGSNFATRNITPGNTSSELTTVNQAVATGDVLNIKLANGTAGLVKNGARFSITLKKT